ncbi:MAG: glycosyltransferase [Ilumatobacteraceae bacterium]
MSGDLAVAALVDGRVIDHPTAGERGVGRYTIGFVRAMMSAGIDTAVLCSTQKQRDRWQDAIAGVAVKQLSRDVIVASRDHEPWFICTQLMLHPVPLDVIPRIITEADLRVAAIVHDVIPQRFPERYLTNDHARVQTRLRTLTCRSIDRFCANSTFTADTSAIELGVERSRIDVVGAVVEPQFQAASSTSLTAGVSSTSSRRSVVAVTGADQRKNTERLITAWSRLPEATRRSAELVVACAAPQPTLDHWHHLAVHQGVGSDIRFTGEVTDDELVALMQQAVLGVMPSLEEGFGLPIAEMVACETPVLCSATSSMPEVAGCDDALFDPYDIENLARLLDHALNDAHFRQHVLTEETQRLQRWTVDQVGAEIVSALQQPTRPRRTPTTKPLSVAFAAPHPRSASGIGPYTHMVLEHWPQGDDVIALDDCSVLDERLNSRATQRAAVGVGSIGRTFRSHDVDHLVITLGSSEHHAVSLERAAMGDAHLWLHEATALGAVIGPAHFGGGERWAQQRLSALGVEHSVGVDVMNPEELHRCGITGLEQAIKEARSIIVTSQEGREALTAEYGASLPPITVIPLAHPTRSQSAVGGNRVVSFGVVDDNKRPEELIQLLAKCDDLHLDLIGSITSEQRTKLIDYSMQLGVEERLAIHGRASDSALDGLLNNVRCAVQFREGHPGQMSAAICELLSRGVPVISDMTTHGEGHEGLVVIDSGDLNAAADAVEAFRDGNAAQHAGDVARSHAMQWTATHVAEALREWLLQQSALRTGSTV